MRKGMSGDMIQRRGFLVGSAALLFGSGACTKKAERFSSGAEARLKAAGIILPQAPKPVANYVGWRKAGALVFIAGQGPALDTKGARGRLGAELSVAQGYQAARAAALNNLAQLRAAVGSLDRVRQCLKMEGFVNSTDDFHDQPKVLNGATDLLVEIFGEQGRPARYAVGVNTLPFNVAVEISTVWEMAL